MRGGAFLGGASSRLLPASIPFRYFAAAALFHIGAWAALFAGAREVAGFTGGPGPVLAAIHLLTLGVLTMVAVGAGFQLLPVATRQPLVRTWPATFCFWLLVPGTLVLVFGMAGGGAMALRTGGAMVAGALLVFAALTGDNLRRAGSMPVVAAHGWAALAALVGFVTLGLTLIADFETGFLDDRQGVALLHMLLAAFGFMGLLALGFSQILIPMFALSRSPPDTPARAQLWLGVLALLLAAVAGVSGITAFHFAALASALSAVAIYLWLMRAVLNTGMRKRLGISMGLVRVSWGLLLAGLLLGLAILAGIGVPNAPALFGFVVLVGWLLTFLLGILQRIVPFLASMHTSGKGGLPPLLSDLTPDLPLKLHALLHLGAVAIVAAGIVLDETPLIRIGAGAGFAGALAYAAFIALVLLRLTATRPET